MPCEIAANIQLSRVLAANRPKIATSPEMAATVWRMVSVKLAVSAGSTGMPKAAAPALATVTIDAQMVRDMYQGFMIFI